MGGTQSLLSLAMILGPLMAGVSFEQVGIPAPYLLGGMLSAGALVLAFLGLRNREAAAIPLVPQGAAESGAAQQSSR